MTGYYSDVVARAGRATRFLLLGSWVLATGCLSITGGGRQALRIETEPPGAEAATADGQRCATPCEVVVSKRNAKPLRLEKEGFAPVEVVLDRPMTALRVAGMVAGNLALGLGMSSLAYRSSDASAMKGFAPDFGGAIAAMTLGLGASALGIGIDLHAGAHRRLRPETLSIVLTRENDTRSREAETASCVDLRPKSGEKHHRLHEGARCAHAAGRAGHDGVLPE
jgi:hypothetical protein